MGGDGSYCIIRSSSQKTAEATIYLGKRIAVVIPAHNEARHIALVVESLPDFVDDIIVVDDASTDDTAGAAAASPRKPVVLRHETNQGVGAAVVDGYLKALELNSDVIGRLDGDGQMEVSELETLVEPIASGRVGFVKGNRFKRGRVPESMPFARSVGNVALTFLTKLASGYWHLFDPQNGYQVISAEAIGSLDLDYLRRCGYFFENGLLIELNAAEIPAMDVATTTIYGEETSGINIGHIMLSFPFQLFKGLFRRIFQRYVIRDFSPIAVFLFFGTVFLFGGTAWGFVEWARSSATGIPSTVGGVMLAALPMFAGFELILQAIVLDINGSPR